ncbi:MAG: IS982 family transposase [Roseiflexaceae bacterium]
MDATWIITTFVLIDTAMANLDHHTNVRAGVQNSEVVTVALVAAKYFANNHRIALTVMRQLHYLLGSISHSRLNRRLHTLLEWMDNLPELLSDMCSTSTIYIVDSMPIPVCRRARAKRCTKICGAQYDGTCHAKNERYFGWKLHLICDSAGIPARFVLRPSRPHDTTAVDDLACTLPFGSVLLGDRGYVSEPLRHHLDARYGVTMIAIHRANMTPNTPAEQRLLRMHRKRIETFKSQLEKMGVARLHTRLSAGVSLNIVASLCALSVSNHC